MLKTREEPKRDANNQRSSVRVTLDRSVTSWVETRAGENDKRLKLVNSPYETQRLEVKKRKNYQDCRG